MTEPAPNMARGAPHLIFFRDAEDVRAELVIVPRSDDHKSFVYKVTPEQLEDLALYAVKRALTRRRIEREGK